MLTVRFLGVRDLRRFPLGDNQCSTSIKDEADVRYAVQARCGSQEYRTRYIDIPKEQSVSQEQAGAVASASPRSSAITPTASRERPKLKRGASGMRPRSSRDLNPPLWAGEMDIVDREGIEATVKISLLMEVAGRGVLRRQQIRHSTASIEMETFRAQPEKRVSMWLPLRPSGASSSTNEHELGSLHLDATYSDDYSSVAEGYWVGMFCGFSPSLLSRSSNGREPDSSGGSCGGGGPWLSMSDSFSCLLGICNPPVVDITLPPQQKSFDAPQKQSDALQKESNASQKQSNAPQKEFNAEKSAVGATSAGVQATKPMTAPAATAAEGGVSPSTNSAPSDACVKGGGNPARADDRYQAMNLEHLAVGDDCGAAGAAANDNGGYGDHASRCACGISQTPWTGSLPGACGEGASQEHCQHLQEVEKQQRKRSPVISTKSREHAAVESHLLAFPEVRSPSPASVVIVPQSPE